MPMTRYEAAPELRRALKYTGSFLLYTALLYLLLAGGAHLLKKAGSAPAVATASAAAAVAAPVRPGSAVMDQRSERPDADTTSYWVYLGEFSGKKNRWIRKNFDLGALPEKGQQIISLTDLFKWNVLPCPAGEEWKLGVIMGLIPSSGTVEVVKVEKVRKEDYWALVRQ